MNIESIKKVSNQRNVLKNVNSVLQNSMSDKNTTDVTRSPSRIIYATGKRKTAIAKVWMSTKGSGIIMINDKNLLSYFQRVFHRSIVTQPLEVLKVDAIYDFKCKVLGSGLSGQAGAVRHGISRALNQVNDEFHKTLRRTGLLTRDSRRVERKKYGRPKARKSFQFSKR